MSLFEVYSTIAELNRMRDKAEGKPTHRPISDEELEAGNRAIAASLAKMNQA